MCPLSADMDQSIAQLFLFSSTYTKLSWWNVPFNLLTYLTNPSGEAPIDAFYREEKKQDFLVPVNKSLNVKMPSERSTAAC